MQCGEVIAVPTDTIYGLAALVQVENHDLDHHSDHHHCHIHPHQNCLHHHHCHCEDTIYGLAALVQVENYDLDHHSDHHHHHIHLHHQSKTAVERLYNIKGRQPTKPIAICVGEVQDVQK